MPIYNLNNKRYNIPDDVVADFERDNPEAIVSYSSGDKVYDIPVNKRDRFLKKYPDAKPYADNQTESSKPYDHVYDENMNLVGGAAYDDITKGSYKQDPKVRQYILDNKPDMFKPKTADMYGAHDKEKSEFDLMNEDKLYQMKAMRAASTIGEQLDERIKANESALNEARKKQAEGKLQSSSNDRGRYSSVGLGGTIKERQKAYEKSYGKSPSRVEQTNMNDDVANLLSEQEYLKESKKVLDASKNDSGFFQGMKDAIDASYLSFGLTDKLSAERIASVQQKLESGQALTDSEQSLLTSLGLQQMVNEQYNDLLGRWYKAGMVTAEMAPFMAEMAVNPLSGLGKSAMKWTVKKFGEKGAKAIAAKVLSRTIGDVAGAAGMAATTGMPGVAADASDRQRGYVTTELGDKGTIKGVGFEGGENASDAWRKAFTARTIENWSEMVGEYFSPVGKAVGKGFAKAFDKMGLSKVNDFIDNINSSEWVKLLDDFSERTQWNGPLGEFAEEQVGMIANAALVGDTKWSDITDLDKQLDVALGVGVFGTAMSLLRIGGYRTPKYRARKAVENADKEGLKTYGEELWAKVKETIDLSSDAELGDNLATLLGVTGASQEQAVAAFKYANALKAQQAVNTVKEKTKIDMPGDMEVEAEAAYDEGSELETPWEKHEAKRAVDRAERALGVGSENSDEQQFAQMVMNGVDSPVETVNAMAEQGYTEEQIQKAKDYYTAVHRMNGLTDALLDKVDSQIDSANAEVDLNTNRDNGSVIKVILRDGREGYVVEGSVVRGEEGRVDVNNSDDTVMVRLQNGEVQMMNPNKDIYGVVWIDSPEQVKEEINAVLREDLINQAIGEIDWNPATPNPKVGDSFEINGVPVVVVGMNENGLIVVLAEEWQKAQGKKDYAFQSQYSVPASEYKNWASAQLDAQEDAQAMAQQETVVKEDLTTEAQQPIEEKRPITENEANEFISRMGANAEPMPNIEFTPENWQAAFGENGTIETPIGTVKMGENQISKLFLKKRTKEFGMIAPTLSNPDIIIEEASSSKEGQSERESSYLFIKTFVKDGQKVRYYTSVTVLQDGMEVSVSSHVLGDKQVPKKLMEGNVIYIKEALSSNSSDGHLAEQPNAVPDLLPTQENNASLSTNKDSDKNVQSQGNEQDFVAMGAEKALKVLGEQLGEKLPHKVEVTAKAWSSDLKKAQQKVDKAQEDVDNAPIGRDAKQKKALEKAEQELAAIQREAEFWAEMDAEIKNAKAKREAVLNPQADVVISTEPMTTDEFIAQQLAAGNIVLSKEDYMAQTGYGKNEVKSMNGGTQKLITDNGMTLDAAGERLMEMDRENGTNFFNQDDATAGRDALIALLGSVRTRKELNQYIAENRKAQAKKESEAIRNASEEYVMSGGYESLEDYLDQMEAAEMENPFLEDRADEIMAIFAEEAAKYEQSINNTENGQGTENENAERSDTVLPEESSDNTGGIETDNESASVGNGVDEEGEGAYEDEQANEVEPSQSRILDVFNEASRIAAKHRKEQIKARAKMWEAAGVKVKVHERTSGIHNMDVRRAIMSGEIVAGWYDGEVHIYLPNISSLAELDKTILHEAVSHMGLRELMSKENFDKLCDKVWGMMPKSAQDEYINYPGVNGSTRAAADEYMAHLAEDENLSPEEKSLWQKIVQWFKDLFTAKVDEKEQAVSILNQSRLTDKDISELLKLSYANLKSGANENVSGEGTRFRFSKSPKEFDAIQKEAVEKKGIVMPGLNEAVVDVLSIEKHDFNGNLKQARKEAQQWAIENYQGKEFSLPDEGGSYTIGKKAINKYVDKTSIDKSDNAMIHLSALKELPNIISSSVTGEVHADYKKDENGERNADNGIGDKGLLVHRMYGAIKLDGKTYRVKTTMNEYRDPLAANNPHSYEVTEIELIESSSTPSSKDDSKLVNVSNNSITGAKLLNGVEKSYDKGKKLLDESEKTRFRVTPEYKQHQMDIINETNPAPDDVHSWIRSVEDIKSFEEALDDSDYADYKGEDFDPSYTWDMVEDALGTGKVTVYSSYPIKNGVFVTPSYMEAQSYGGATPYMAKVNLEDVAWIDPTQGQLATDNKVTSKKAPSGVRFRMTNAEKEALRDSEETKALFEYAKKRFGRTFDLREAGYVLPDGSMLDFSGRHEMSPGSDTSFLRGDRTVDHRYVQDLNYEPEDDGGEKTGFKTDMADFINRGAIRIDNKFGLINLSMKPTKDQKVILQRLIQKNDGDVYLDFADGWNAEHHAEYEGVRPMRIFSDIDKYYDEGVKPEGNTRFRIANKNQEIFVSNAQKAVEGIKQEKGTPQQWLAMIEKNGGLKAGEDKWLGLSDWLRGLDKKSVTKDEILDFINQNKIQIEEVKYADREESDGDFESLIADYKGVSFSDSFFDAFGVGFEEVYISNEQESVDLYNKENGANMSLDEYGYLEERDEETLIEWAQSVMSEATDASGVNPINSTRLDYTTEGLENKAEIALTVPTIEPWNKFDDIHFGDAGGGRAIAWIRFGETTAPQADLEKAAREADDALTSYQNELVEKYLGDEGSGDPTEYLDMMNDEETKHMRELSGKMFDAREAADANQVRVLVIDEIQSKRHQEGREKGYKSEEIRKNYTYEEVDTIYGKQMVLSLNGTTSFYPIGTPIEEAIKDFEEDPMTAMTIDKRVPEAPFEKNWSELAFKRMLRYAAENGFDKVAWTTGAQQAERYDLGGVVEEIYADHDNYDGNPHKYVSIRLSGGNRISFEVDQNGLIEKTESDPTEYDGRMLSDVVGKDIAEKIVNLPQEEPSIEFGRQDLYLGGEGMKGFYDKMLPSFVNKYVKKWGTKVQDIELPNVEEAGRIMHSVDVTDAMKESVMEGQTMFRVVDSERQKQIDKEYVDAIREGNFDKAVGLFREYVLSKAEDNGVVPIDYAVGYRGHSHSSIAKKVKEENPDAISEAAYQMSKRVPKGSILVPMPSRSGKATYTIKLAEAIAKATDSEVMDVLKGEERMSVYEAKKKGLKIDSRDLGLYVTEKLPKNKNVIIIDNVIDRGITALAAVEAVDGGSVLAYAFTKGSKDRVIPLKLSDPITYDDNLRIIPLSERFNANTDDLRYRVVKDPAVDYISQAEDVVEVPKEDVMYTINNIASQLYKTSGRFMRELYKHGTIGRVLKGEYAEIDQIKAKQEYDHAKPILEEYLNELVWMKYQSTEAAQEVINDVISDVEYAMQYYKDLSLGKDVWRTKVRPRFRISEKGKQIQAEVDKFTAKYNSKPVVLVDSEMTDEELEAAVPGESAEDLREALKNENCMGGYLPDTDKIYIFVDNQPTDDVEGTMFHENVHGIFHDNVIVDAFDKASDGAFKAAREEIAKLYAEKHRAEELFAYVVQKAMNEDDFKHIEKYLAGDYKETFYNKIKEFGYDTEEEIGRRAVGRRTGSDNQEVRTSRSEEQRASEEVVRERRAGQDVLSGRRDSGRSDDSENGPNGSKRAALAEVRNQAEQIRKLFDQVADMGLEGVIGNAEYNRLMLDIFHAMPKDIHGEISVNAVKNLNLDVAKAVSDYLGANDNPSVWEKVVGMVRDALRKVGFDLELTPNDVKYMLWRSKKPLNRRQALDVAEDIAKRSEFGVSEDSGTRFRTKKAVPFDPSDKRDKLVKAYDAFLKTGKFNFIEAFQDRMYSVKVLMDMIVDVTGKKVRDFEDAYTAENQLGSINKPEEERYLKDFYKPLVEVIRELSDKYGREVVERYIYCKSGLERNEVLRQRDADEAYNDAKAELDDKLAKGQLTQPQYDALLQQADDQRQKTLAEDVDYSGIRGMLYNVKAQAINKDYEENRIDKKTRDARLAQLEANKKDEVKDWKQFAEDQVAALEAPGKASKAELDKLWKKINAATNETLRMDYESGMIDKETYDAEKKMMKYYVPLRNWADTTAEEMYEYRSELVRPVSSNQKRAKGRESQADNPIATIALMAQNAIVRGNRNKVKQKFYAFVANRETGLASVRDVWYEKDSATGDWTPKYADTSKAKDAAEFAQILDDFENSMKLLEEQGLAYKGKLPFGMKFRASRQQKMAHVVPVMINGKEYAVYVNGNPRPAQAINGETNSEAANASAWYDKIKRIYGAGLTSWNPDFIIPNMIRDGIHASTMTFLDAGPWAAIKFAANGPRAFGQVFAMVSGMGKNLVDPKYQAYFEEFVTNGGETGYTAVHTLEDYKKEYDKLMKEVKGLKGKNLLKGGLEGAAKWLEAANRIFEDVNRFNAYVSARESGESIMRSVNAAKNITVNFNRKGALSANNTTFGIIANAMSKWILFFNPAVQGLAQLVTKTKMNRKRAAMMASTILASGVLMPMLNEALVAAAGDDEEDDYWNQSDFKRRNNWLLFTGDGYVSVPLPPVLRELYGIGDIIYGSITGRIPAERAVMDMARQIQSAIGFINLIPEVSQEPDAVTWAKGFAPDVAAPILDVLSNTNFMGRPIAKWTDFNKYDPEYERVYKGVSPQWVELSKILNEMGGQEGRRSDLWGNFINPAMMEHLFTSYGGGIGKTINNLAGMALDAMEGNTENLDPYRKSPIAPRFYIPNDEKTVVPGINRKYYDYDYKYNIAKKSYKNYQEGVRSKEHPEWQKYIDEMNSNGELKFIRFFEQEAKKVKKLQNLIKEDPKNKKELEEKLIDVKAEIAVKCYEMLK